VGLRFTFFARQARTARRSAERQLETGAISDAVAPRCSNAPKLAATSDVKCLAVPAAPPKLDMEVIRSAPPQSDKMQRPETVALAINRDYRRTPATEAGTNEMGTKAHDGPQRLSTFELQGFARALELSWPSDSIVRGVWWPGGSPEKRNYEVTLWTSDATPLSSTWVAERTGDVYRLRARPANPDEIHALLEALRELDALESDVGGPIAEAQYDCRYQTYQLCFTPVEEMLEGLRYERWVFRRHSDGRPLSVGYLFATRRGAAAATLPGGSVLRGDPWPK
jgi:hypothetical protein